MAKNHKTNKRKQQQAIKAAPPPREWTRRRVLNWAGVGVLGAAGVAAGGAWAVSSFNRSVDERDLTKIGQGVPAVVQIHDPSCPLCNALQRETRKALAGMKDGAPVYIIADLTQTEGAVFAQHNNVQHVTLMLFDAQGNRVDTLTGTRTRKELSERFTRLMR
ncbi:MAG: hypothetical protein ABJJ53_18980 [Sulfitobacter sp.]